ncbi:MAG: hypothetical protein QOD77_1295 [Thermoplasmata archaeon]|jgi:uncharacterized protein HemX|nr:hypothetical protein [Thermoplasmata archaeon]
MASGKVVAATIGAVLALGLLVAAFYQMTAPPGRMAFARVEGGDLANATALDARELHAVSQILEDHLDTALERGGSEETLGRRVEGMHDALRRLTGQDGPEWTVAWKGQVVRVAAS